MKYFLKLIHAVYIITRWAMILSGNGTMGIINYHQQIKLAAVGHNRLFLQKIFVTVTALHAIYFM